MQEVKPRQRWRHTNGNEYTVLYIANEHSTNERYPKTVVYQGEWGKVWARLLSDWHRSMTLVFPEQEEVHEHDWFDARNPVVQSGEMCLCGAIRSGNVLTNGFQVWWHDSEYGYYAEPKTVMPRDLRQNMLDALKADKIQSHLYGKIRALRKPTGNGWIVVRDLGHLGIYTIAATDHDPSEYL